MNGFGTSIVRPDQLEAAVRKLAAISKICSRIANKLGSKKVYIKDLKARIEGRVRDFREAGQENGQEKQLDDLINYLTNKIITKFEAPHS